MDNGVGETKSTNGILLEEEIMDTPAVTKQPSQPTAQYGTEQPLQNSGVQSLPPQSAERYGTVPQPQSSQQTVPQPQSQASRYGAVPQSQVSPSQSSSVSTGTGAIPQAQQSVTQHGTMQQPQSQASQQTAGYGTVQSTQVSMTQSPSAVAGLGAVPQSQASQLQSPSVTAGTGAVQQSQQSVSHYETVQSSQATRTGTAAQTSQQVQPQQQSTVAQGRTQQMIETQTPHQQSQSTAPIGQIQSQQVQQPTDSYRSAQQTGSLQASSTEWQKADSTGTRSGTQYTTERNKPNLSNRNIYGKPDIVSKYAGEKSNIFLGLIGAVIGDVIGAVFIIELDHHGFWGAIGVACLIYFVIAGYAFLGGGIDIKGMVVCAVLTAPTVWVACQAGWALWYMGQVNEVLDIELDFKEVFPNVRVLIKAIDYSFTYYLDMILGVIVYLIGLVESSVRVYLASKDY